MNPIGQNSAVPPDPPPIPTSKITANKDLEDLNLISALKQKTPQGNPDEIQYKELINLALNNPDFLQALQSALVKVNNSAEDAKKRKGDDQFKVSTNFDRPVKNYNKGNASNKIDNHDPNPKPNSTQKNIDSQPAQSRLTSSTAEKLMYIKHGTHLGKPSGLFLTKTTSAKFLAQDCKWTIVGSSLKESQLRGILRKLFIGQFQPTKNKRKFGLDIKRPDGSEDGEWPEIEYENAPSYQLIADSWTQQTEDGFQEVSRKKGKQNRKNAGVVISEPNTHDQKKKTLPLVEGKGKNATNETTNNVVIGEQQQRTEKGETSRLQEEKQDQNKGEKILDEETHTSGNKHKTQRMILQKRTNIRAINKKTRMTTKRLIGMIKPIQE
ncbi:hypothetical protein H5410_054634 [Solanum commersonii]|uniref:Uncharacterized protein n=1 Tax=Solanum commersonii TaxID=4109 RepID=A0A9J5WGY8_SOLCO|nr:hypothetical protein H5410_054634 [Solanum commersonii]